MEKIIEVKKTYNSLESLQYFLNTATLLDCSIEYDIWEEGRDAHGHMQKCIVIKKSAMNAVKVLFMKDNHVKVNHIVPHKILNVYLGNSKRIHHNILEFVALKIKEAVLAVPQKKAFEELETNISKAAV